MHRADCAPQSFSSASCGNTLIYVVDWHISHWIEPFTPVENCMHTCTHTHTVYTQTNTEIGRGKEEQTYLMQIWQNPSEQP